MTDRPEVELGALRDRLFEVLRSSAVLKDSGLEPKLLPALRKIAVAQLLDEAYFVAVTGLQGVGKTTLVRKLYDLPDDDRALPDTQGRGEQLPIWVVEWEGPARDLPRPEVIEVGRRGDRLELVTRSLERAEFAAVASQPAAAQVLLKLYVPPTFFGGPDRSFLLLPGFEQRETLWVSLARHALAASDAAVFVVNETTWAQAAAQRELNRVCQTMKDSTPVLALSFADLSGDGNAQLRETVMEAFAVPGEQADRIVITSASDVGRWRDQLRAALDRYAAPPQTARVRQLRHLEQVLQEEVRPVLWEAEEAAGRTTVRLDANEFNQVRHIVDPLREEVADVRKAYAAALDEQLNEYRGIVKRALEQELRQEKWFARLKEHWRGRSLEEEARLRDTLEAAWTRPGGDTLQALQTRVLDEVATPRLRRYDALPTPREPDVGSPNPLPEDQAIATIERNRTARAGPPAPGGGTYALKQDTLRDICLLMVRDKKENEETFGDHILDSVRALPSLALEAVKIGTLAKGPLGAVEGIRGDGETVGHLRNQRAGILMGVGAMLGLDLAVDGELDLVKDLARALGAAAAAAPGSEDVAAPSTGGGAAHGLSAGASVAAVSPVAFAVVAAGAAVYTIASVSAALNRATLDKAGRAYVAIDELADRTRQRFLVRFDAVMDAMVAHVENRLGAHYNLDLQYAQVARLHKALADARDAQDRLLDRVATHPLLLA